MDAATILGLVLGVAFMLLGILPGGIGGLAGFCDAPSAAIVLGGTAAATMVACPADVIRRVPGLIGLAFKRRQPDLEGSAALIMELTEVARREGLLALDYVVKARGDQFMQQCISLVAEGCEPGLVRDVMEAELDLAARRHGSDAAIFDSMASFSTAFGIAGALVGLARMLGALGSPQELGPGMATAIVSILYGTLLANLLFAPLGKKLRHIGTLSCLHKELVLEGVLSIQYGDPPRVTRQKLDIFLARGAGGPAPQG